MKIFQIVNGICHWQTPYHNLAETAGFPKDCVFVEAPDYVKELWKYDETKEGDDRFIHPEAPEGWIYDDENGTFFLESDLPRMLDKAQKVKQEENKILLAKFLENHPMTWVDGKQYGVTYEDQSEISLNIQQYQLAVAAKAEGRDVTPTLQWHAIHESCVDWTIEEMTDLAIAIQEYVYPWFQLMNEYKKNIYEATDYKEVEAMALVYKTEEEITAENEALEAESFAARMAESQNNTEESTEEETTEE